MMDGQEYADWLYKVAGDALADGPERSAIPTGVVLLVTYLDEDGDGAFHYGRTGTASEALGLVVAYKHYILRLMAGGDNE